MSLFIVEDAGVATGVDFTIVTASVSDVAGLVSSDVGDIGVADGSSDACVANGTVISSDAFSNDVGVADGSSDAGVADGSSDAGVADGSSDDVGVLGSGLTTGSKLAPPFIPVVIFF